jgi:hypothetical protein
MEDEKRKRERKNQDQHQQSGSQQNSTSAAAASGQFSTVFWDLRPDHKPDISLAEYTSLIKLFVAAT